MSVSAVPASGFDGRRPVLGCWLVGDEPAGMGVREDISPITSTLALRAACHHGMSSRRPGLVCNLSA